MKEIESDKINIDEVFKDHYNIPSYQRHYVWGEDNINALLDDLCENMVNTNDEEYFLGSFVRQKRAKVGEYDLIDGQQRITTIFLLFSVIRDYPIENKDEDLTDCCQKYIWEKGNKYKNIAPQVRLQYNIRDNVGDFINDYIVPMGGIVNNWDEIEKRSTDKNEGITTRNVCSAIITIWNYFNTHSVDLSKLFAYIINNVVMIYVSADSLQDAFRFFSILNNRGMSLSNSDIIKSENLQESSDIDKYAKRWDVYQDFFGDDFDRFLSYVRTMIVKDRARVNLLEEYENNVFKAGKLKKGDEFFKEIAKAYNAYTEIFGDDKPQEIEHNHEFLNLVSLMDVSVKSTDWVPVLLSYYIKFGTVNLTAFMRRLTTKTIGDWACRLIPSTRIDNLNTIIKAIDNATKIDDISNDIFSIDGKLFIDNISSDIYGRDVVKPLLLLLDFMFQDQSMLWNIPTTLSVEHILPQNPSSDSRWCEDFSEQERIDWTHKIGNLCLIGRRKNTSLGRLDYTEKKDRYFKKNISNCPYTLHLYNSYDSWTLTDLKCNQEKAINLLAEVFGVKRN